MYVPSVSFEVHKGDRAGGKEGEVARVTIPWELRGRSEIIIFLADRPIRGIHPALHPVVVGSYDCHVIVT